MPRAISCSTTCGVNSIAPTRSTFCVRSSRSAASRSCVRNRTTLRRARPPATRVDHDVHGGIGRPCHRETGRTAECDGEGVVRRERHTAARQGVGLSSRQRFSTAFVGSSNLSHAAQTEGLEWNVRMTQSDQPALLAQMQETFDQYWADAYQFESYEGGNAAHRARLTRALSTDARRDSSEELLLEIEPRDFQKPVLEELVTARELGRHRNLMVAATGTGKTVMAALDYRSLRAGGTRRNAALRRAPPRDSRPGAADLSTRASDARLRRVPVPGRAAGDRRHVFASIDSLGDGAAIDPAAFDHVILDEAHHAAAESWHVAHAGVAERIAGADWHSRARRWPRLRAELPRPWIGNLRVWNAIPHALVPFRYYMLDVEGADLRDLTWTAGPLRSGRARRPTRGSGRGLRVARGPCRCRVHREAVRHARYCLFA